jgi:biotin carboxylase
LDDTAVWLCNALSLGPEWQTAGPQGICAELALNKKTQTRMAAEAGFNVPITQVATNGRDVLEFVERESFPIILRPADCVSVAEKHVRKSRNWICASHDELSHALHEWRERMPLLIQPFIRGVGEGIFGLASVDGVAAWSAHRRLRMMNPQGSGSSACISQPVAEELKSKIEMFLKMSDWRGLFMIELLRDCTGKTWFVEFNGRPWGSMALSRRQGLEYPAWHIRLAIDEKAKAKIPPVSQVDHVCRNLGREIMHVLFVLRGPRSKAFSGWPSFWKTLAEIIRVRRGESFYNWRRGDLGVFIADCYYTIHGNLFKSKGY